MSDMIRALTPIAIQASQGFTSLDQELRAPTVLTARIGYCLGPMSLRTAQDWPYAERWAAWGNALGVMLKKVAAPTLIWTPDETGVQSSLFSAPIVTNHLSLAFDQVSAEVVAYQKEGPTVEVRRLFNGAPQAVVWPGFAPLAVNNGQFNSDVPSGDTDIVVYYLREGRNAIFARIQREDYAIERVAANIPAKPIDLLRSWYDTGTRIHRIEALDSGWRSCILATDAYPVAVITPPSPPAWITPSAPAGDTAALSGDMSGTYLSTTVDSSLTDVATLSGQLSGSLMEAVQQSTLALDAASLSGDLSGNEAATVVSVPALFEAAELSGALSGTNVQTITDAGTVADLASLQGELTGAYS